MKTKKTLQKVFDIAQKFADKHDLFCECSVASAFNQNSIMIYASDKGLPIDSSVAYWNIDVKNKLTFSGIKPHASLWMAYMFDHWDGGSFAINNASGEQKFINFLGQSLSDFENKQTLQKHVTQKRALSR